MVWTSKKWLFRTASLLCPITPLVSSLTHFIVSWKEKSRLFLVMNWVKVILAITFLILMLIVKFGGFIQEADVEQPDDLLHNWTRGINRYAMQHTSFRSAWQITSSLMLDIQFFMTLGLYMWKGFSLRIILTLVMFYSIRALLQQLFILPFPDDFFWESPGFPCLMNVYGRQSDFFYSGHVGFSLLCTIENFMMGVRYAGYFGIAATCFQAFTLITFQVHFTIDVFTGLVMAHYCYHVCQYPAVWLDKK